MLKNCQSRNDCDQSFIKIMINDYHTDSNVSEDIIYEDTREYNWWGYNLYREFARKNSYDLSVKNSISDSDHKSFLFEILRISLSKMRNKKNWTCIFQFTLKKAKAFVTKLLLIYWNTSSCT